MQTENIPGAAIAIVQGGELLHMETSGRASRECEQNPVDQKTRFGMPLAGRAAHAIAMIKAAEDELVDLHAPITDYVPYFRSAASGRGDVSGLTLDRILRMQGGVQGGFWSSSVPCSGGAPADLKRFAESYEQPLWFSPGTMQQTSEPGYSLSALALAEVMGETYPEAVRRLLYEPLGITPTHDPDEARRGPISLPSGEASLMPDCAVMQPTSRIFGSIEDMARLAEVATGGDFLSAAGRASLSESVEVQGSGLGFLTRPLTSDTTFAYVTGFAHGYWSDITLVPEHDFAVVTLLNHEGFPASYVALEAIRLFLGLEPEPIDASIPRSRWQEYVGTYIDDTGVEGAGDRVMEVRLEGDELRGRYQGNNVRLEPSGGMWWMPDSAFEDTREADVFFFRIGFFDRQTGRFFRDAEGRVTAFIAGSTGGPAFLKVP